MLEEMKIVLRNVGEIDPVSVEEYRERGGYEALQKALLMTRDEVLGEINESALRGRGGAGFPIGKKLSITKAVDADQKYIICNADEGEPGTNKDRVVL